MRRSSTIVLTGLSLLLLVCAEATARQSDAPATLVAGGADPNRQRWVTILDHRPPHGAKRSL